MKLFSQRRGLKPVKSVMQVDSMDADLRNSIWNALTLSYWNRIAPRGLYGHSISNYGDMDVLIKKLWHLYFKSPLDTLDDHWPETYEEIRKYFFTCKWNEVYDFIEFIANNYSGNSVNQKFMDSCNSTLERELSAYRFVGGKITQITSEEEIAEIEEALDVIEPFKPGTVHLKRALGLLSDKTAPDYRNSIKESISAVEAICNIITDNNNATLGKALNEIEKGNKVELHPALKGAFDKLYGYTSSAEGIRHALLDEANLEFEDAKFMLVSCSAFINYLISKSSKAGIKL